MFNKKYPQTENMLLWSIDSLVVSVWRSCTSAFVKFCSKMRTNHGQSDTPESGSTNTIRNVDSVDSQAHQTNMINHNWIERSGVKSWSEESGGGPPAMEVFFLKF